MHFTEKPNYFTLLLNIHVDNSEGVSNITPDLLVRKGCGEGWTRRITHLRIEYINGGTFSKVLTKMLEGLFK